MIQPSVRTPAVLARTVSLVSDITLYEEETSFTLKPALKVFIVRLLLIPPGGVDSVRLVSGGFILKFNLFPEIAFFFRNNIFSLFIYLYLKMF